MDGLITMAHGAGGKKTAELINNIFKKYLINKKYRNERHFIEKNFFLQLLHNIGKIVANIFGNKLRIDKSNMG